jgi:DNA-binding Lrp family transcriptional regulator
VTSAPPLTAAQARQLRHLLEEGLPLVPQPYRDLARQIDAAEDAVLAQMRHWNAAGLFRRIGMVLHHRALGYRANAMLVLDVPDELVERAGQQLGSAAGVNLCYQRPRRLPDWPYNLFCMVHGQRRGDVRKQVNQILQDAGLDHLPHRLLFSTRQFKQRGGRYTLESPHG